MIRVVIVLVCFGYRAEVKPRNVNGPVCTSILLANGIEKGRQEKDKVE